eukprot:1341-Heterococcus_DN1.PRE.2
MSERSIAVKRDAPLYLLYLSQAALAEGVALCICSLLLADSVAVLAVLLYTVKYSVHCCCCAAAVAAAAAAARIDTSRPVRRSEAHEASTTAAVTIIARCYVSAVTIKTLETCSVSSNNAQQQQQ